MKVETQESSKKGLSVPAAIIVGSIIISFSILIGGDVIRFKKPGSLANDTAPTAPTQNNQPPAQAAPPEDSGPVQVSVDDDAVLGDKNAPVTLIEFSDYECPFCKRYFQETYPQLKKDYIDTGKVKLVFRDLPLPFHDPMATTEAIAANCAKEQGGDSAYYKFHDQVFTKTTSNGNGLTKDQLYQIAKENGLNDANFRSCLDSEKYKDEVAKDNTDAAAAGASGTPTFFIGKSSSNGTITATKLVGAQPYASFKALIDSQL